MNTLPLLAVDQPHADLGPFAPLANKIANLGWGITGVVAVICLTTAGAIFVYEKYTMKQSGVLNTIVGTLGLVGLGTGAASIVNFFMQ